MGGLEPIAILGIVVVAFVVTFVAVALGLAKMHGDSRYESGYGKRDREWLALALKGQGEVSEVLAEPVPDDPFAGLRAKDDGAAAAMPEDQSRGGS